METGLAGKVALVTGASGGIGAQMVRALDREGARVVIHYHTARDAAVQLMGQLQTREKAIIAADLTSEQDVARLWDAAEEQLGPIEIVFANAGI